MREDKGIVSEILQDTVQKVRAIISFKEEVSNDSAQIVKAIESLKKKITDRVHNEDNFEGIIVTEMRNFQQILTFD